MKTILNYLVATLLALVSAQSVAALRPGEGVVRDPVSGNYTATFWDADMGRIETADFEIATKIEPTVHSSFRGVDGRNIRYDYRIHNGKTAKQPINNFDLNGLPVNSRLLKSDAILGRDNSVLIEFLDVSLSSPNEKWSGSGVRNETELNIGWLCKGWDYKTKSHNTAAGIQPGEVLSGFGLSSPDLPGIFQAQLLGNTPYHQFSFSGPGPEPDTDIERQMYEIEANDFVPRNIAAPMIAVPSPFDPAIVLENLRAHVSTWPDKQLADAAFASELDRNLQAAANAYRTGQSQEAREYIEILFGAIRRDHKDLDREDDDDEHEGKRGDNNDRQKTNSQHLTIDRLAAKVLDFDLKYILKRVKEESKDHDGKGRDGRENKKER